MPSTERRTSSQLRVCLALAMKLSWSDGSTLSGAQVRYQLSVPVVESADAVGRYRSFGRDLPVSCAMYLMKGALKLPPAMRIFRFGDAPCRAAAPQAPDTRVGRLPSSAPTDPTADRSRKSLRFMIPPSDRPNRERSVARWHGRRLPARRT